jgi:hypothetical protein
MRELLEILKNLDQVSKSSVLHENDLLGI